MCDVDAPILGRGEARARWLGFRPVVWLIRGAWWTLHARAGQGRSFLWGAMVAWVGGVWMAGLHDWWVWQDVGRGARRGAWCAMMMFQTRGVVRLGRVGAAFGWWCDW